MSNIPSFLIAIQIYYVLVMSDSMIDNNLNIDNMVMNERFLSDLLDTDLIKLLHSVHLMKLDITRHVTDEYYWLYTRTTVSPEYLRIGMDLNKSAFKFGRKTWILIHGWHGSGDASYIQQLKTAFINRWDVNVIVVNWYRAAKVIYPIARTNIIGLAKQAYLLLRYFEDQNYPLDQIHIVGHSLGAHFAGLIGKHFGRYRLGSITGLDPANPLFSIHDPNRRLDKSDAKYVEVLHTNAGKFGMLQAIGDTDIYVNGGTQQPKCEISEIFCSHMEALSVYRHTIEVADYHIAFKCNELEDARNGNCRSDDGKLSVGGDLPKTYVPGIYWLSTI